MPNSRRRMDPQTNQILPISLLLRLVRRFGTTPPIRGRRMRKIGPSFRRHSPPSRGLLFFLHFLLHFLLSLGAIRQVSNIHSRRPQTSQHLLSPTSRIQRTTLPPSGLGRLSMGGIRPRRHGHCPFPHVGGAFRPPRGRRRRTTPALLSRPIANPSRPIRGLRRCLHRAGTISLSNLRGTIRNRSVGYMSLDDRLYVESIRGTGGEGR
mmetsp:Transcript_28434/g.59793  ORF Transcript_28434/g.59793 Transcript_28434/m.59793 type:complete len:208 (+) Transcript_28434:744-1367(+)